MQATPIGPDFARSALIIVDMQNDFLPKDGSFGNIAREHPEATIDLPFLVGTVPHVQRLADAFRTAGRPVVYVAHVLKPDYSDAAFPYWRIGINPGNGNRTHCVERTWGAQIVDELTPREGEHLVVKKGFGGFANTQLDTILRNMAVNTCVVSGVTTCVWFEPQRCDLFVTEATFGLPVFRHPPDTHEIGKLLHSVRLFPERCHLVGVYALGKCQRVIALLRAAGYDEPSISTARCSG